MDEDVDTGVPTDVTGEGWEAIFGDSVDFGGGLLDEKEPVEADRHKQTVAIFNQYVTAFKS